MQVDYLKLQKSEWNTSFKIELKTSEKIIIEIAELIIDEVKYRNGKLILENPQREWAMFWDDQQKVWKKHTAINSPIGKKITAFNAKTVGDKILISFGGNHSLGFSRWGFYVDKLKFETREN